MDCSTKLVLLMEVADDFWFLVKQSGRIDLLGIREAAMGYLGSTRTAIVLTFI